jgi:hypothetical protein
MVWGYVRLALFCIAFLTGFLIRSYVKSFTENPSVLPPIPTMSRTLGVQLRVVCDNGHVIVTPLSQVEGSVQLECAESNMIVVGDSGDHPTPIQLRQ